jgi:hypothetical protein
MSKYLVHVKRIFNVQVEIELDDNAYSGAFPDANRTKQIGQAAIAMSIHEYGTADEYEIYDYDQV